MDPKTKSFYDKEAATVAQRHADITPTDLYALAESFFIPDAPTIDLGCGMGRDTAWLNQHGFPAQGFDGSTGMLDEARRRFPGMDFTHAELPELAEVKTRYTNVFCSAVIMHVPRADLLKTVSRILELTNPHGRIILSYRGETIPDGRLIEIYHPGQLALLFEGLGGKVLYTNTRDVWHTLVIEKRDLNQRDGIALIQDIIQRDKKTATYKFALLRALCEISRYEPNLAVWNREADQVLIPLGRIAIRWLGYYLPLIKAGIRQTTNEDVAFGKLMRELSFKPADAPLAVLEASSSKTSSELSKLIQSLKNTIKKGPVAYSGIGESKIFGYVSKLDASVYRELRDAKDDFVTVPINVWRDMILFGHWIEDSLIVQWAELSAKLNQDAQISRHFDLLTKNIQGAERTTLLIRKLLKNTTVHCVWSGKKLDEYAVDHMIPWSIWRNNDLWNLLPCSPKLNLQKSDSLPHPELVVANFDAIETFWEKYARAYPELFESQIKAAIGERTKESLCQTISRVGMMSGARFWGVPK